MPLHVINEVNSDPQVAIYKRTTVLTDEQIKALPSTGVEVVPAPGEGKIIIPVRAMILNDFTAGAYTNNGDASLLLGFSDGSGGYSYLTSPYRILTVSEKRFGQMLMNEAYSGQAAFDGTLYSNNAILFESVNQPLLIADDYAGGVTDYTGGHPDNFLKITVLYSIMDV